MADGTFTLAGALPDGTTFTCSRTLSPDGQVSIRQVTPAGIVTGQVQIVLGTDQPDVSGSFYLNYTVFDEDLLQTLFVQVPFTVTAEAYSVPAADSLAVPLSDGTGAITITTYAADGDQVVGTDLVKNFTLALDGSVTITDDNAENVTLQVNNTTGAFTGMFTNPGNGLHETFKGVLLQDALEGDGQYQLGTDAGPVTLSFQVGSSAN
jgi:hypothetical protein